jgi:hypothetical protein
MSVLCLNLFQQAAIIRGNTIRGINQTDLARFYGVSRRTIQRVLIDAGVLHYNVHGPKPVPVEAPKTVIPATLFGMASQQRLPIEDSPKSFIALTDMFKQNDKIVQVVRSLGFTEHTVAAALDRPELKRSDVEVFLARLPDDELATILYTIGLVRVKQHDARAANLRTQKEAANG